MKDTVSLQTTDAVQFLAAAAPGTRLLALDVGTKTIGIATSDATRRVASPLTVLKRTKFTADSAVILVLAKDHVIGGFVIGLPRNMDGSEGDAARSIRSFAFNLARAAGLPVLLWDERLSTFAVDRQMIEADVSRAKRAERIDQLAAAHILEGALGRLARLAQ